MKKITLFQIGVVLINAKSFSSGLGQIPLLQNLAAQKICEEIQDFTRKDIINFNKLIQKGVINTSSLIIENRRFAGDLKSNIYLDFSKIRLKGATFKKCKFVLSDLSKADLSNISFSDTIFMNVKFNQTNLRNSTFKGCKFVNCELTTADLTKTSSVDTIIKKINFAKKSFKDVSFDHVHFEEVDLSDSDLSQTVFNGITMEKVDIEGATLWQKITVDKYFSPFEWTKIYSSLMNKGEKFKSQRLDEDSEDAYKKANKINQVVMASLRFNGQKLSYEEKKEFKNLNLRGINLHGANLTYIKFLNKDLRDINLKGAHLAYGSLNGTDLTNANLDEACLYNTTLYNADLTQAHLRHCSFIGIILKDAILTNSDFEGSDLEWVSFRNTDLITTNLKNTKMKNLDLQGANLPDGLDAENFQIPGNEETVMISIMNYSQNIIELKSSYR